MVIRNFKWRSASIDLRKYLKSNIIRYIGLSGGAFKRFFIFEFEFEYEFDQGLETLLAERRGKGCESSENYKKTKVANFIHRRQKSLVLTPF